MTLKDFCKQVKEVENVNIYFINVNTHKMANPNLTVLPYPFKDPMNGKFTLDDLMSQRIEPCVREYTEDYYVVVLPNNEV